MNYSDFLVKFLKKSVSRLILLTIVIIFCLLTGEIVVRAFYDNFYNYDMEMWRYARDLKQPLYNGKLPFWHFPDKKGYYYGVTIKTNSFGFRDLEYPVRKPAGLRKRIVFIGDSQTLGWGVPLYSTFPKQLEALLNKEDSNKYDVINMGVGNYNSMMEVELFERKGLQFSPDLVVLMYCVNDTEQFRHKSKITYFFLKNSYFISYFYAVFSKVWANFDKRLHYEQYYKNLYSENSEGLLAASESIRELTNLCDEKKIKLLIVSIPNLLVLKNYPFGFATDFIKGLADKNNVSFLDLFPCLSVYPPKSLWVTSEDTHLNVKADTLVAEEIYKKLKEDKKLDFFN